MSTPSNTAAWQPKPGVPGEVREAPYTAPGELEIVIRNAAVAINPADWLLQDLQLFDWMQYPCVLGNDVAGDVIEIGPGVSRFQVGDRVVGQSIGCWINAPTKGGFQHHTVLDEGLAAHVPDAMPYTNAVVLPLALSTAACGLFQTDQLALHHPMAAPKATGQTLLVWGGASSVGCNGIQLAVAAGYRVVTTASAKNSEMLKRLGAADVIDYRADDLVNKLGAALDNQELAGALHTVGDMGPCFEVIERCSGRKFVSSTGPVPQDKPDSVECGQIFGMTLKDNEVGPAVWVDFLGPALADGRYHIAPEPWVIGKGLELVQSGIDTLRKGVSAKKIVIELDA